MPAVTTYDALLSGHSWNGVGVVDRPAFVTYSFDATASPIFAGSYSEAFLASFHPLTAAEQALARQALAAWADVSGLALFEVPAGLGDIRLGTYDFRFAPSDRAGSRGFAYTPYVLDFRTGAWEEPFGGDIFLDRGAVTFETLIHEIGHAIGLKHPFEGETTLDGGLDDLSHTVMTYNPAGAPPPVWEPWTCWPFSASTAVRRPMDRRRRHGPGTPCACFSLRLAARATTPSRG